MNTKLLTIFSIVLFGCASAASDAVTQTTETFASPQQQEEVENEALESWFWRYSGASQLNNGEDEEPIGQSNWFWRSYRPLAQMNEENDETIGMESFWRRGYRPLNELNEENEGAETWRWWYRGTNELNEENEGTETWRWWYRNTDELNDENEGVENWRWWYRSTNELNEENEGTEAWRWWPYRHVSDMTEDEEKQETTKVVGLTENEESEISEIETDEFSMEQNNTSEQQETTDSSSYWTYVAGGSLVTFSILSLLKIEFDRRKQSESSGYSYEQIPDGTDPTESSLKSPTYTML